MSKFPQNEWVEIDGQRVPFTKPQHYIGENNEEVRLTGEKDPLPVKVNNKIELPEDYPDKKVKKELEKIKNELKELKEKIYDVSEEKPIPAKLNVKNPESEIVFNEVIEDAESAKYKILTFENIPNGTQSVSVNFRKNSQTNIRTQVSFFKGGTLIMSKDRAWKTESNITFPAIGDRLRVRIMNMDPTTSPILTTVVYFYMPQPINESHDGE